MEIDRKTSDISVYRSDGAAVEKISFKFAGEQSALSWQLDDNEHVFGLGENTTGGMDKRGKKEQIWVIHSFEKCDKPVPFLLSTSGYGFYLHCAYKAEFDIGKDVKNQARCFVDNTRMDIFLLTKKLFPELISNFTELTGRSPMPPRWAFGYWQSTTRPISQAELEKNIAIFENKKISVDVIAIDPVWQKPGFQSWQWNRKYFPNPSKFLSTLKSAKTNLALWTCPFINHTSPLYDEAVRKKFVMENENGLPGKINWWMGFNGLLMDSYHPEAVRWWGKLIASFVKSGVNVLKIDGGDTNETIPGLFSSKKHSMRELHNLYPVLFAKAVHESMKKAAGNKRTITWIRTGFTGIQRYPCCWGGDQEANFRGGRVLIKAGQQSGLAGIPYWSHDLGGFAGRPTEEYYIRSFQWGLLSPLARAHGYVAAPWEMGKRAEKITGDFIRLRYRLLTTIYSYAWNSHVTGEPMMRAMVIDNQEDKNTYDAEFQYMFGHSILVAPVYKESNDKNLASRRTVYLPEGRWYDFWSDKIYAGGKKFHCKRRLTGFHYS